MQKIPLIIFIFAVLTACGASNKSSASAGAEDASAETDVSVFDADSAYSYVKRQVDFGPRVPNTEAHEACRRWLVSELRRHGAEVTEQNVILDAFDGTRLNTTNIIGSFNPDKPERILLLAHYDCRPWADKDPDPAKHKTPVDGANDAASGVGVLLEVARQLGKADNGLPVDIVFVDSEDWGSYEDDDSWALGARYFAEHPFREGYRPSQAILLDMVGARGATFYREHFSEQAAPRLAAALWACAAEAGAGDMFINEMGSAVNDDHLPLIKAGIPAIDVIDYRPATGFEPTWHTVSDNMDNIDSATLGGVGRALMVYLLSR